MEESHTAAIMSPLLMLSIVLIAGLLGRILAKSMHVPGMTGNLAAGIIIGPTLLNLFHGIDVATTLRPLSTFAMGLITVSMGSHLSYRRIHNALRRITTIALFEVLGATIFVTALTLLLGAPWPVALTLGCIAAATSPATTLSLVREQRAKGSFVKTLLSVVAIDNILCIILFAFASNLMISYYQDNGESLNLAVALKNTLWMFGGSFVLAMMLGKATSWFIHKPRTHDFSVVFVAILLLVSIAETYALSPLLTGLFFGVYLGNASPETERQVSALEPIELLLFSCFFTIAGASLHLDSIRGAGLLCMAYLIARFAGKSLGALLGGRIARAQKRVWSNIAIGLTPQAAIAIGLVLLLHGNPSLPEATWVLIETIVLGAVAINEIVGPFFTRYAIKRAGEKDKDRRRLIEFLQEEFIMTDLHAKDKWEALQLLNDFYVRTHGVAPELKDALYDSIKEREKEFSTGIGHGAAIPHGRIQKGHGVRGVLGISREGIDYGAPDGRPVHILMLVVTPQGYEKEHLEIMASLVQIICHQNIRDRLVAAINPYDVWEVLEHQDARDLNYFMDDEGSQIAALPTNDYSSIPSE